MKTFPWIFALVAGSALADAGVSQAELNSSIKEPNISAVTEPASRGEVPEAVSTDLDVRMLELSRQLDNQLQLHFQELTPTAPSDEDYLAGAYRRGEERARDAERRQRGEGIFGRS
jgi:hypothetical protein